MLSNIKALLLISITLILSAASIAAKDWATYNHHHEKVLLDKSSKINISWLPFRHGGIPHTELANMPWAESNEAKNLPWSNRNKSQITWLPFRHGGIPHTELANMPWTKAKETKNLPWSNQSKSQNV